MNRQGNHVDIVRGRLEIFGGCQHSSLIIKQGFVFAKYVSDRQEKSVIC